MSSPAPARQESVTDPTALPPPGLYAVSVRSLCEFTAKRGDLDRRFTPSATALEGLRTQQLVQRRRGPDYEAEITLARAVGPLWLRGRADGYDPHRGTLEEIKTLRGPPQEVPENRQHLHWAQLQCYGALFCAERGLDQVTLALVYYDLAAQAETELVQVYGADELTALLDERCAAFAAWAAQEQAHRAARDDALRTLAFPRPPMRDGQHRLARQVYRAALSGRTLLAQAPTGIGKTLGTLYPALRALPEARLDKLAFLTPKGTGVTLAQEALGDLREAHPGPLPLRVLTLVPKHVACEHPDKACHGDACPLARGFFDRLPAARADAAATAWLDETAQRQVARRHGVCPYYLGQEMVRWADVLVGDVHHFADPHGVLWGLSQALDWRWMVLVDEAHNLVERARQMYGGELHAAELDRFARSAPATVAGNLRRLADATAEVIAEAAGGHTVLEQAPTAWRDALQTAVAELGEHFQQQPLATGPLLTFHFTLRRFFDLLTDLGEPLATHALLDINPDGAGGHLALRNVAPAPYLRPRWAALKGAVLFSATLTPPEHTQRLLGLPPDTAWLDVPPAFPPEHLTVRVAQTVSTRWRHREASRTRLARVMAQQFDTHPGNYLAFFSSFDYLQAVAGTLAAQRGDIPQWQQQPTMDGSARQQFLARFVPGGRGIGFAVLGGVFAEGVDLPGSRLIGAFIATLGLPPVSPVQQALRDRLKQWLAAAEAGSSESPDVDPDLVPALHRVVQAAGRVLRTPTDRGWLWLLDDRYRQPDVVALLPPAWGLQARDLDPPHGDAAHYARG